MEFGRPNKDTGLNEPPVLDLQCDVKPAKLGCHGINERLDGCIVCNVQDGHGNHDFFEFKLFEGLFEARFVAIGERKLAAGLAEELHQGGRPLGKYCQLELLEIADE